MTAYICSDAGQSWELEVRVTIIVAVLATMVIVIGAIPRILLNLNDLVGWAMFSNWNRGYGAHVFWFAEAVGLSLTFGMHPFCVIGHHWWGDNPFVIGWSTHLARTKSGHS